MTALSNRSKSERHFKSIGAHESTASTERIDAQQPTGKVNQQTVDITLFPTIAVWSWNVWHAAFHDEAVITSGPADGQALDKRSFSRGGTSTAKGTTQQPETRNCDGAFLQDGGRKVPKPGEQRLRYGSVIEVPSENCQPDAVKLKVPSNTLGVVEQPVEITYDFACWLKVKGARHANFEP